MGGGRSVRCCDTQPTRTAVESCLLAAPRGEEASTQRASAPLRRQRDLGTMLSGFTRLGYAGDGKEHAMRTRSVSPGGRIDSKCRKEAMVARVRAWMALPGRHGQ